MDAIRRKAFDAAINQKLGDSIIVPSKEEPMEYISHMRKMILVRISTVDLILMMTNTASWSIWKSRFPIWTSHPMLL